MVVASVRHTDGGHRDACRARAYSAAQEVPWLILPFFGAALAAEWSMVRSRVLYPSDIFAGAAISVVVALVAWRWPSIDRRAKTTL